MSGHAHQPESEHRIWPAAPVGGTGSWGRLAIGLRRLSRRVIGTGSVRTPDGVRYRPVGHHSLTRSLSRRGPGYKEYDAHFPSGETMRIRARPTRVFADLTGSRFAFEQEMLAGRIRPGSRALAVSAGTGDLAHWLAEEVGPSGAVVALEEDEQSVQFARLRYPAEYIAFEQGGVIHLGVEPAGAFEFVLAPRAFDADSPEADFSPLARLVAPGGTMGVSTASGSALASGLVDLLQRDLGEGTRVQMLERAGIALALAQRAH